MLAKSSPTDLLTVLLASFCLGVAIYAAVRGRPLATIVAGAAFFVLIGVIRRATRSKTSDSDGA
jgi:uncharacterized membrane protein